MLTADFERRGPRGDRCAEAVAGCSTVLMEQLNTTRKGAGKMDLCMKPTDRPLVILAYPRVEHEQDYLYHWMPFSLLTIAAALRAMPEVDVVIFDGNQHGMDEWEALLDAELPRALCIGLSIMTGEQIRHALERGAAAKRRDRCPPLVFGGPHVNVLPAETVKHELVDFALQGPGQNSMPQLAEALLGKRPFDEVAGLWRYQSGAATLTRQNPPKAGVMSAYPWDLLNVAEYIRDDPTIAPRTLNYISSQGCVYKCQFCYELTYQRKWSAMATGDVLGDIRWLCDEYALSGIKFYDADFFVNVRRAYEYCDALIDSGLGIAWAASINPNDVLRARKQDVKLLARVAESGCRRLLMGMESGDDRVLRDVVKKDVTSADLWNVAQEIADRGIRGAYTFIVGFPGESPAEVEHTYALMEKIRTLRPLPETRVHLFGPFPGTTLFDQAVAQGFVPPSSLEEWSDFNYYESQTPWTSGAMEQRAWRNTKLVARTGRMKLAQR
jgi:anaerobic magnesium-protoporphyrin IX monomethyl ester cyclase